MNILPRQRQKTKASSSAPSQSPHSPRSFTAIMEDATHAMPRYQRLFSNFIHIKTVSLVADILGRTIARPNALVFGAILSFAVTLSVYLLSKNYGYSLSGFESIGSFLVGWFIGLAYDLLVAVFRKK